METADKEKFAITLLEMINKKREEIKLLTSEIIELEEDPKNVVKIKQNAQSIVNVVASCTNPKSYDLKIVTLIAEQVFRELKISREEDGKISPEWWHGLVTGTLEDFCIQANAWNPLEYDFNRRRFRIDFKNLNLGININK